jgi:hypothetical protein
MKYTVRAYLLRAGGKVARDLGKIDIDVSGPLTRGAMATFQYLDKTEVGRIDRIERYNRSDKAPTVHIVQSQGE